MSDEPQERDGRIAVALMTQVQFNLTLIRTLIAVIEHTKVDDKGAIKAQMRELLEQGGEFVSDVKKVVEQIKGDLAGAEKDDS